MLRRQALRCNAVRVASMMVISCVGLACTGHEPAPTVEIEEVAITSRPMPEAEPQAEPAPERARPLRRRPRPLREFCPEGAERQEREGGGPGVSWQCMRGNVPHGPFYQQDFDERHRTWYQIHGGYRDGERHGLLQFEGYYPVAGVTRPCVFMREWFDRGRIIRSNRASVSVELDAAHPVVTRRFLVKARGLAPMMYSQAEPAAIGSFNLEVWTSWADAPSSASPSVLRVELATPTTPAESVRADALLHPLADSDPPATASDLPPGYSPELVATWRACEPTGCELELDVTLHWIVPGSGHVEARVTARAVPNAWPEDAPVELTMIEPGPEPVSAPAPEAAAEAGPRG